MSMDTLKVTLSESLSPAQRDDTRTQIENITGVLRTAFGDAAKTYIKVAYNPNCTKTAEKISNLSGVTSAKYYPY